MIPMSIAEPADVTPGALAPDEAERLATVMHGLASPMRLQILSVLREGPASVGELCARLGVAQALVSNHLRLMRHLQLVTGSRDGRYIYYTLFDEHVSAVYDEAVRHLGHTERAH